MERDTHSFTEIQELIERLDEEAFYAYDELYGRIHHENAQIHDELAFYEALMEQLRTFRKRLARLQNDQYAVDAFLELEEAEFTAK